MQHNAEIGVFTRPSNFEFEKMKKLNPLNAIPSRILITLVLSILACWTVYYCWPQRAVRYGSYTYSDKEAQRLRFYPKAQVAHGMRAWFQQQPEVAARYFRQAVSQNVLFLDAWLRLSETELAMGHEKKAKEILTFTLNMTDKVFRWKWPQMLLARELGMQKRFYRDTNDLLSHNVLEQDALQLLHTHFEGQGVSRCFGSGSGAPSRLSQLADAMGYDRRKPFGLVCDD